MTAGPAAPLVVEALDLDQVPMPLDRLVDRFRRVDA